MKEQINVNSEHLTATTQTAYSRGGDIFMDQGQNEHQAKVDATPAKPNTAPRSQPVVTPSLSERGQQIAATITGETDPTKRAELIASLASDPEFGIEAMKNSSLPVEPKLTPEDEKKRAEIVGRIQGERPFLSNGKPYDVYNLLNPNVFTNPDVKNLVNDINADIGRYMGAGMYDELAENLAQSGRDIVNNPNISPEEKNAFAAQINAEINRVQEAADNDTEVRAAADNRGLRGRNPKNKSLLDKAQELRETKNMDKIMQFIRELPLQDPIGKEVFEEIVDMAEDEGIGSKPLNYLVQQIISAPLDSEFSRYELEFYARTNLGSIVGVVRSRSQDGKRDTELFKALYNKINVEREAVVHVHEMNKEVVTGNLEQFIGAARSISPEQLQVLQQVKGVGLAMRLYDAEIQRIRARDGFISDENYQEIFGLSVKMGSTGQADRTVGTVEKHLDQINKGLTGNEKMEDWELRWALNLGRTFINNTLRAAEQISLSNVAEGPKGIAGIPQEDAVRLMNWVVWIGKRFNVSEPRGSQKLLELIVEQFQEQRKTQGYGETHISKIGSSKLEDFELAGIWGGSGVWSGWRQELIVLQHAPVIQEEIKEKEADGKKTEEIKITKTNLFEYLKTKKEGYKKTMEQRLFGRDAQNKQEKSQLNRAFAKEESKMLKSIFLRDEELKNEFSNSLGILLKQGIITPKETDALDVREMKERIRAEIWKRVALDNPLAIQSFLDGMEIGGGHGHNGKPVFEKEFFKKSEVWNGKKDAITGKFKGEALRDKLVIAQEKRMRAIISAAESKEDPKQIPGLDYFLELLPNDQKLTDAEKDLLQEIRTKGIERAGDLANVRFAFNPFMNDVLFEKIEYGDAGSTFYKRRTGGDLPSFHAANQKFGEFLGNPGAMHGDKVLEMFLAMVEAVASPNGTDVGQDKILPIFDGYLEWTEEGGQITGPLKGFRKWWSKQSLINGAWHTLHKPTSIAQQYYGIAAPSENEEQAFNLIQQSLTMGILRGEIKDEDGIVKLADTYNKRKRKHKASLGWLLAALIRDWGPLVLVGAFVEFGRSVKDEK